MTIFTVAFQALNATPHICGSLLMFSITKEALHGNRNTLVQKNYAILPRLVIRVIKSHSAKIKGAIRSRLIMVGRQADSKPASQLNDGRTHM
jgi:hypothetical protein